MPVIVGAVIEKDGKYLLVQEAKAKCRGKWNFPAGHLDPEETIFAGACREAREETGCDIELTGVCQIGNCVMSDDIFVSVIFTAKLLRESINVDTHEILDVRWFTYDEIVAMKDKIRNVPLMLGALDNVRSGLVAPLEIIKKY